MRLCDDTITVFNSYVDPTTRFNKYLPTIIHGVSWFGEIISAVSNDGLISANQYIIRIPKNSPDKPFVSPREYAKLQDKTTCWTLAEGDTIVKGEITVATDGETPSSLENKYDNVVTVVAVTDNRRVKNAPHWKVVAR